MEQRNNTQRLIVLLRILEDSIEERDLIGIAIWSNEAFECMLHIQIDNGL
jgi:hypothetical protein